MRDFTGDRKKVLSMVVTFSGDFNEGDMIKNIVRIASRLGFFINLLFEREEKYRNDIKEIRTF